eukprot:5896175-Heterocapsa_arctica.AAC.1
MAPQQKPVPQVREIEEVPRLAEVVGVAGKTVGVQGVPECFASPASKPLILCHMSHLGRTLVEVSPSAGRFDLPIRRRGSTDVDRAAEVGLDEVHQP